MSFKTLMVHAQASVECEANLRLAASLANQFEARLIGIGAETYSPVIEPPETFGPALALETEAVARDLARAESRFRDAAAHVGAGISWRSAVDFPEDVMARESRAADLVVTTPRRRRDLGFSGCVDPGDLLMKCGRPILVAPPNVEALHARHILVGWTDTRESRRAVADALPFLQAASQVIVVEVCHAAEEAAARTRVEDVANHLDRHGVKAKAVAHLDGGLGTTEGLLQVYDMQEADLLVCGGYGHSRLREWVFGGVTSALLEDCERPVLLSR